MISIITPVYNAEEYLADAIESVISQTYRDFELILINDGSKDSSLKIMEEYQKKYPEIIKIIDQTNMGVAKARNNGLDEAIGDFIAFLDADDYWAKNKLEKQLKLFKENPKISFAYSGYYLIDEKGNLLEKQLPYPAVQGNIYTTLWISENNICNGTIMVKKKWVNEVGGFDESLSSSETLDFRIKLAKKGPVSYVNEPLYYYRRHVGNLSSDYINAFNNQLHMVSKHFGENGINDKKLWKKVMARLYYNLGSANFNNSEYSKALKNFLCSLSFDKYFFDTYVRISRCLIGNKGNQLLRSLKQIKRSQTRGVGR